jgi:hypothetical protein
MDSNKVAKTPGNPPDRARSGAILGSILHGCGSLASEEKNQMRRKRLAELYSE